MQPEITLTLDEVVKIYPIEDGSHFKKITIPANGKHYKIEISSADVSRHLIIPIANLRIPLYIELTGDDYGDIRVEGVSTCHVIRSGNGWGTVWRSGDGKGSAIRKGNGGGSVFREGKGHGHAIKMGIGRGIACRRDEGKGYAIAVCKNEVEMHKNYANIDKGNIDQKSMYIIMNPPELPEDVLSCLLK